MGQKVNPIGLRLGINKSWDSTWFADKKDIAKLIKQDHQIRTFVKKNYYNCGISKVEIERTKSKVVVNIYTGRPGMLIGAKGVGIESLRKDLARLMGKDEIVFVNVKEVKRPDLDAVLVAEGIASQLERRMPFRRALRGGMQRVMRAGAKGCKVQVSGVVDGANTIAREEKYMEGSLPLHTLRADIDYGVASAYTNYGKLGVKVWIFKGEILNAKERKGGQQ
jgi:small subunit ribosomal protein S3